MEYSQHETIPFYEKNLRRIINGKIKVLEERSTTRDCIPLDMETFRKRKWKLLGKEIRALDNNMVM